MSDHIPAYRPEKNFRDCMNRSLEWQSRQEVNCASAVCICGTFFDPESGPSPRMLSRMNHAHHLIINSTCNTLVVAAGGTIGTGGSLWSEAQLICETFRSWGYPRVYRDDFSSETIGNVIFVALGILAPLGITNVTFVTDTCHAPRVDAIAQHLLADHCIVVVAASPWPLSPEEEQHEHELEARGGAFVDQFLAEVSRGDLVGAFEWVAFNHKGHPYLGWDIEEIITFLRGQLLDFGVVTAKPEFAMAS